MSKCLYNIERRINKIKVRFINKLMTYPCLDLCIKLASSAGLWRENESTTDIIRQHLRYLYPRFLITTATFKLTCIHVYDMYNIGLEPIPLCENLMQIFMFLVCIVKATNVLAYMDRIQNMATTLKQMENRARQNAGNDEQLILDRTRLLANGFTVLYPFCLTIAIWFNMVVVAVEVLRTRDFFLRGHYPEYLRPAPFLEFSSFFVISTDGLEMMLNLVCDTLMVTMIIQLNGLLKILRYRLTNIRQLAENGIILPEKYFVPQKWWHLPSERARFIKRTVLGIPLSDIAAYYQTTTQWQRSCWSKTRMLEVDIRMGQLLKENAMQYAELISFADELDTVFSPMIVMQLTFNIVGVTTAGLILTTLPEYGVKANAIVSFLLGGSLVFFLCSALSAELTSESDQVRDALFNCDWLGASDSFKRSMRIIMCRANKPVTLMVGGFIKLSLEVFYDVTKLSYSYYQVLRTIIANYKRQL